MQRDDVEQRLSAQPCRVVAHVALVPETTHHRPVDREISADLPEWLTKPQRDDLSLGVLLFTEDRHGRLIEADTSFGIAGPRNGAGAAWCRYHPTCSQGSSGYRVCALDISESIDQMLGRDPELHSPPRLAWDSLLAALWAVDLHVTVERLQAIPLAVVLGDDVEAELDRIQRN
jgi:hypothetical protein